MTIRRRPGGTYLKWYYDLQNKGKARRRAARPKRGILSVKQALAKLKLRYCQEVSLWSPHHRGKHGNLDGGLLWLDFVIKGKRPFVIIYDDPKKRYHKYERKYLETKRRELDERSIPYVLLPAGLSSQEYWVLVYREMKKKGV